MSVGGNFPPVITGPCYADCALAAAALAASGANLYFCIPETACIPSQLWGTQIVLPTTAPNQTTWYAVVEYFFEACQVIISCELVYDPISTCWSLIFSLNTQFCPGPSKNFSQISFVAAQNLDFAMVWTCSPFAVLINANVASTLSLEGCFVGTIFPTIQIAAKATLNCSSGSSGSGSGSGGCGPFAALSLSVSGPCLETFLSVPFLRGDGVYELYFFSQVIPIGSVGIVAVQIACDQVTGTLLTVQCQDALGGAFYAYNGLIDGEYQPLLDLVGTGIQETGPCAGNYVCAVSN